MKQFLAFIRKEFYHITRDRWTMMIILAMPVVMLVLFGFAISTDVKNTPVAICDPSRDTATQAIVDELGASEYFRIERYLSNPDQIDGAFKSGIGLVVVFSERFAESLARSGDAEILLVVDGSDPNNASTLINYATNIIASYQQSSSPGAANATAYRIDAKVKLLYNPRMKSSYNFVPGVMGMVLMLICAMMTSISIAREKEKGTMEVLLVSPMRPIAILLAKTAPYLALSLIDLATILCLSVYALEVPIRGSLALLVLISIVFIFLALALGLLISSVADSQTVALLISGMALMMPVLLLSGMMFPIENMPLFLRVISNFVPARWYIRAVKKIMIEGLGVGSVLKELAILSAMAAAILALSLKKFKVRLE